MEKLFIECKYFFEIDTPYEKQYMNISNDEFQLFTENKQKWWKYSKYVVIESKNLKYVISNMKMVWKWGIQTFERRYFKRIIHASSRADY